MKKIVVGLSLLTATLLFSYCSSSKKAAASSAGTQGKATTTYAANVASILETNCAPCHFPDKGGNKKALDSYAAASSNIDDILRRVQLNPGDRGFMPMRHAKLADATIATLKQWKADGLAEK
ncbi:MAG TPA: hypothetical protein VG842_10670 [Sediminibacterium sp.]|nr:hypothetical protein [Sediminibacterium sp.]